MRNITVTAVFIGIETMGYTIGEEYTLVIFVYPTCMSVISPTDKRFEFKDIIALMRNFDNINKCE